MEEAPATTAKTCRVLLTAGLSPLPLRALPYGESSIRGRGRLLRLDAVLNGEGALFASGQKAAGWPNVIYGTHRAACYHDVHSTKSARGDTKTAGAPPVSGNAGGANGRPVT